MHLSRKAVASRADLEAKFARCNFMHVKVAIAFFNEAVGLAVIGTCGARYFPSLNNLMNQILSFAVSKVNCLLLYISLSKHFSI